jgi:site-specific recombinase XerD
MFTVQDALAHYLDEVAASRSPNTYKAYRQAADHFATLLAEHHLPPAETPIGQLSPDWMAWFIQHLRHVAVATEQLYLTALSGFYEHAAAEGWVEINLPAVRQLRRRRARREATRLPEFPREEIEAILDYVEMMAGSPVEEEGQQLRVLRDRALLFVLADTGMRVSEACGLTRGHLDWHEGRAIVLGKGNKEAVVRFSERSLRTLRAYLDARAALDGVQGKPLGGLALFARHDRAAGKRVLGISARSAEKIIERWAVAALGESARGAITPHSFRHYFVTMVLRGSGGNIRMAQELARHKSIATTERYTHLSDDELDRGYHEIFNV